MDRMNQTGAGGWLEMEQAAGVLEEVMLRQERQENGFAAETDSEAELRQRMNRLPTQEYAFALAERRAIQLSHARRMELFLFAVEQFRGREWEAFPAVLVGSRQVLPDAGKSVEDSQGELRGHYIGGFIRDLEEPDEGKLLKILSRGDFDDDIADALWRLGTPGASKYKGPKEAMDIARVIFRWQEKAGEEADRAGAWLEKVPGYVVCRGHDRDRMLHAGETKWTEDVMKLLDWSRAGHGEFLTEKDRKTFLHEAYATLTLARSARSRLKNDNRTGDGDTDAPTGPETGNGDEPAFSLFSVRRQTASMNHEPVLPFQDGKAWLKYSRAYGRGNVREAVLDGLSSMADRTALMRILGPGPYETMEAAMQMLEREYGDTGNQRGMDGLAAVRKHVRNLMEELDGFSCVETDSCPTLAAVGRITRARSRVAGLGNAFLSGLPDAPVFADALKQQGHAYLSALAEDMKMAIQALDSEQQQRVLSCMRVFADSMAGDILARVSGEDRPGAMTRMQAWFFRLNASTWWTDSWRRAVGLMVAHDLAEDRNTAWRELPSRRRSMLERYAIGEAEWELMRKGQTEAADGRTYFTPDTPETLSDADIAAYLRQPGARLNALHVTDIRAELAGRLETMLRDCLYSAIPEPNPETRSRKRQKNGMEIWPDELLHWVTTFRAFPVTSMRQESERLFSGNGRPGRIETVMALVRLMAMGMALGYLSMTAEDLLEGCKPRDPRDGRSWLAAFVKGGSAGFYGDFILGNLNQFGRDSTESPAGPAAGDGDDLAGIWTQMRKGSRVGQNLARFIQNSIPGTTLSCVRSAVDYLITYAIYDMMKPGFFTRVRKHAKKENSQNFFMQPE